MSGTHLRPALASYRDAVTKLIEDGTPLGEIEDAINAHAGLTEDQRAALWLFAFSLSDRSERQRDARDHLSAVEVEVVGSEATEQAPERTLGDVVEAGLGEQAGTERYQRCVTDARSGKAHVTDVARPREFDAKGFPIPQTNRSLLERVGRLLNPE